MRMCYPYDAVKTINHFILLRMYTLTQTHLQKLDLVTVLAASFVYKFMLRCRTRGDLWGEESLKCFSLTVKITQITVHSVL